MTEPRKPAMKTDPMYQLLRQGKIKEFNARRAEGESCDLRGSDLRGLDLRGLDADQLDLSGAYLRGAYLRGADLRGLDLSGANLEGASINAAKISGTYFPREVYAEEITLSLLHGTRMRYQCMRGLDPASKGA
ncbi:MAG TPA: pentapeptide repeat-containing protein [Gammaproteobacteria bacterium]|nr:pentapeptide repeat-containing protein [Gammaproteobacteria bacterium]